MGGRAEKELRVVIVACFYLACDAGNDLLFMT